MLQQMQNIGAPYSAIIILNEVHNLTTKHELTNTYDVHSNAQLTQHVHIINTN